MRNLSKMYCEDGRSKRNLLLCSDDGGDNFDTSGLFESLAQNATDAYTATEALHANPLNTALVYGGTAQTQQGLVGSATANTASTMTLLLGALLIGGIAFVALRR